VQALRTRRVDVRPLISAQLPIADAQERLRTGADRSKSTKVQLVAG
jgi:L-idonate 5-dehydrogenase